MEYKILEKNGEENENIDGGAFNNFTSGGKSGIIAGVLDECKTTSVSNSLSIGKGLLLIKGVRVKITEPIYFNLQGNPAVLTNYQLVAKVELYEDKNIDFSIFIRTPKTLAQDNLYVNNSGVYELEIAKFSHSTDGKIINLERTCELLKNTTSGSEGGGASNLPLLSAYPIGSVYITTNEIEPAELFGGTWEKIKDTFLLASGDTYSLGTNGGSADAVVVSHTHTVTWSGNATVGDYNTYIPMVNNTSPATGTIPGSIQSTGVDGTEKNMPPYLVVNVWVRIA